MIADKVQLFDKATANLLGVRLNLVNMEQVLMLIDTWIQTQQHQWILTADATALVIAHDDKQFFEEIRTAGLVTIDGAGISWALKRAGLLDTPKVSGVDLVEQVIRKSAENGHKVFFLGAAPEVAAEAALKLMEKYPGTKIVGTHHGFVNGTTEEQQVVDLIKESGAQILFVAMGMPRQERFIMKYQKLAGVNVAVGVGGSFDVFSGRVKRAPFLMQKMHLEWLWRLLQNPTKIQKVKQLPRFVNLVRQSKK